MSIQFAPSIPATISAANARLPQTYENAKTALANCAQLDECQDWADKAAALASYAKQANDDEMMKMAVRIRDRAIRRAGELLKQIEPGKGGRPPETGRDAPTSLTRKQAAGEAGLGKEPGSVALSGWLEARAMADVDSRVAVFRQMLDNGGALADEIERDARSLAEKLERLHGGSWSAKIDHQVHAIFIARWGE